MTIELIYCGKRVRTDKSGKIIHHFKHALDDGTFDDLYYGHRHMPTHLLAVGCTYEFGGTTNEIQTSTLKLLRTDNEHEKLSEWILLDELASSRQTDKIVTNKIKKQNKKVIQDMTLSEINNMAFKMSTTQKNILAAKVLEWIL